MSEWIKCEERLPECIAGIINIQEVCMPDILCGVYLLFSGEQIVYVGKSINVVPRIFQHKREGQKVFDKAYFLPCHASKLDEIEGSLIYAFRPKYNGTARAPLRFIGRVLQEIGLSANMVQNQKKYRLHPEYPGRQKYRWKNTDTISQPMQDGPGEGE